MTDTLALANFEPQVSKIFKVTLNGETVELTLTEIQKPGRTPENYECFTLLFQGPLQPYLPQAIYSFENDGFKELDLFLVPVAGDDKGFDYEVIVNRKIS